MLKFLYDKLAFFPNDSYRGDELFEEFLEKDFSVFVSRIRARCIEHGLQEP